MALLRQALLASLALVAAPAIGPAPGSAQLLTQDEALALAFPGGVTERRTAYLTDEQLTRARRLAGPDVEVESAVVTYYLARRGREALGVAYFDAHRVRTVQEVLMVVVGGDGRIRRLETVAFREPPEYRAPAGWLRLFEGRPLAPELSLRGDIPTMTGATLTSGAVTRAARRTLALHQVIEPLGTPGP